jgi:hypothetical protein
MTAKRVRWWWPFCRGTPPETPRFYYRCILFDDGGSEMAEFPTPPWEGVTPNERRELKVRFDEFYRQYPSLRQYAPKEPKHDEIPD